MCCLSTPFEYAVWTCYLLLPYPAWPFVNLASIHFICFTLKSWVHSLPFFKASALGWKSVEWWTSHLSMWNSTVRFHHSFLLFHGQFQLSSITGIQLVPWYGKLTRLSKQPSALRKVVSFSCKMSSCLDRWAVNLFSNDSSLSPLLRIFEMSLFHGGQVVMSSFPIGITIFRTCLVTYQKCI